MRLDDHDVINVRLIKGMGTFDLRSEYVERWWLPVLGPTSICLLRRFALDDNTGGQVALSYVPKLLAIALSLDPRVGPNSKLQYVFNRLVRYRLANDAGGDVFHVEALLPPVPRHRLASKVLPVMVRQHDRYLEKRSA